MTDGIALTNGWMAAGLVATIAFTLLVFLGDRRLRELNYELFLIGHIILALWVSLHCSYFDLTHCNLLYSIFLMGTYWHLKKFFPE